MSKTLYITEVGGILKKQGGILVLYKGREKIKEIRPDDLSQIVVCGNIQITTQALSFLFLKGIDVVFLSLSGKFRGRLSSEHSKNIELRIKQFELFRDDDFRLKVSKTIVISKIKNQLYVMRKQQIKRKKAKIREKIEALKRILLFVERAKSIDSLRGYEGKASSEYFSVFQEFITRGEFEFYGRKRNPPTDEINTLLSLGYTLLLNTIKGIINRSSLDDHLGYFHTPDYGKPSLSLDLMEPWRPIIIDTLVVALINQGIISKEDFYYPEKQKPPFPDLIEDFKEFPVVLKREGLKNFIHHYERKLSSTVNRFGESLSYRKLMEKDFENFKNLIDKGKEYTGVVFE